jgi:hypothetical protein
MTAQISVRAVVEGSPECLIEARGQEARALVALAEAGTRGVSALEVSSWAYRFAAYCYEFTSHGAQHRYHTRGASGRLAWSARPARPRAAARCG